MAISSNHSVKYLDPISIFKAFFKRPSASMLCSREICLKVTWGTVWSIFFISSHQCIKEGISRSASLLIERYNHHWVTKDQKNGKSHQTAHSKDSPKRQKIFACICVASTSQRETVKMGFTSVDHKTCSSNIQCRSTIKVPTGIDMLRFLDQSTYSFEEI